MKSHLYVLAILVLTAGCSDKTLFEKIPSDRSGIHFNNLIADNDTLNVLDVENIYNGGGVGVGDFNSDGLQDLFFSGNAVPNKLYLNKGDLTFEDVTGKAGVGGEGRWGRGVSVVDINGDGLQDIYVCASLLKDSRKRENALYINAGPDKNGVPVFRNRAQEYGLSDTSHSTMAAFFDYDNDGDLDMYLLVNEIIKSEFPNTFRPVLRNSEHPNTDKFFRNDWDSLAGHPVFTNVSREAGITIEGYGHSLNITDFNRDGWKDIYVTNDFLSNNLLYINQKNGTFRNEVETYFKHTSENSMGQDVIDINNDGLVDVLEVDMNPEDNFRKKMMLNPISYQRYQNSDYYGYQYQYVRNVLQINQGPSVHENDSVGAPVFSEVAFFSGIAETDWSWTPVVSDFDNDGFRDIIITNGFPKDVTDHDFIAFRDKAFSIAEKKDLLAQIPEVKIPNYAYRNNADLTFRDVTKDWGLSLPSFSNGAVYADLDNDGDQDLVINNINDEALVYRNRERELTKNHYLQVAFKGDKANKDGFGAQVTIHYGGKNMQVYENTPYRGYLSSIQPIAHFGLGSALSVDSLIVEWPGGKRQKLEQVKADQKLVVALENASQTTGTTERYLAREAPFREVTAQLGIDFVHHDSDFVDFNIQKLLPHKLSEYGPALATGDIDGNGLDDLVAGGSFFFDAHVFLQQQDGRFLQKTLLGGENRLTEKKGEDQGLLLFDADGDADLDLYITRGGFEGSPGSTSYQDRFFLNDGKGNFTDQALAVPANLVSKQCVRAADYDRDGDLDLFVSGRVDPWKYPNPVSSFIYRNETRGGVVKFVDATPVAARELAGIGLVCDALFTDFDNDGWQDLVLAGEWMPVTFFKNNKGVFSNVTGATGIGKQRGLWNTVTSGDFDNDGDIDYVAGNLGRNSFYRASLEHPVRIIAKDFDGNGSFDAFPSLYLPKSAEDRELVEYPAHVRDDAAKQMISLRSTFQDYRSYALAPMEKVLTEEQKKGALRLEVTHLESSFLRNEGNGRFTMTALPFQAQLSVLNGMVAEDFDGDGNLDLVVSGNDYGTEVSIGRYDALNGLYLKGDGKGGFAAATILQSGIYIPGNGKALVKLRSARGSCLLAASQNKGPLKIFELKKNGLCAALQPADAVALVTLKNGGKQRRELYYGSSFLSQSGRFLLIDGSVSSVEITDYRGGKRQLKW